MTSSKFNREQFVQKMAENGVKLSTDELSQRIRAVTHLDVSASDVEETIAKIKATVAELEK